jgi:sulfite reductase (NADPH) hemoprotein beta-component
VLRVFHRLGDYEHKQRNRMKFLIRAIGWTRWREEYDRELTACRLNGSVPTLDIDPPLSESAPESRSGLPPSIASIASQVAASRVDGPGLRPDIAPLYRPGDEAYARWRGTNTRMQKQPGYLVAVAAVPLGDLTSGQMRVLGQLAGAYGDGTVRVTPEQDLLFRWVRAADARPFYERLAAAGLGLAEAGTLADVASCPGAESCRLAVTQSRGLGRLLEEHIRARPDLLKISGCPNGCGQHHIATIGFQGSVRRVGARAVPQYFVMVGGGTTTHGALFARLAAKIPARRTPQAVERLIALYASERSDGESAPAFFARVDLGRVKTALADLEALTEADASPGDFVDLGEADDFAPDIQEGECSA